LRTRFQGVTDSQAGTDPGKEYRPYTENRREKNSPTKNPTRGMAHAEPGKGNFCVRRGNQTRAGERTRECDYPWTYLVGGDLRKGIGKKVTKPTHTQATRAPRVGVK